jgi:uncharacterized membrane protein
MAIGPVQLLVLGFEDPDFHSEVLAELERLRDADVVRLIDALVVHKDAQGRVETRRISQLDRDAATEFGALVGALIGLGAGGAEGMEAGAAAGAAETAGGVDVFSEDEAWDVIDELPEDTATALLLLEHRWAIPLRDAIHRANGFHVADDWVHPLDLVAVGLIAAD